MFLIIIGLGIIAYAWSMTGGASAKESQHATDVLRGKAPAKQTAVSILTDPGPAESPKPSPKSLAAPAAPLPLPRYPVGLEVRFSGNTAKVKKAWQDSQGGWHFEIDLKTSMPLGFGSVKNKAVSEQFLRDAVANQLKQPLAPDQAFPLGVEVYRNGRGGLIEAVNRSPEGIFVYRVKGWDGPVTQGKLLDELVK